MARVVAAFVVNVLLQVVQVQLGVLVAAHQPLQLRWRAEDPQPPVGDDLFEPDSECAALLPYSTIHVIVGHEVDV